MNSRIDSIISGDKGKEMFFKTGLNGSYGYDGMNTEKFTKVTFKSRTDTFSAQLKRDFKSTRKLCPDRYMINSIPNKFRCKTCQHEAVFTLDNSKFWFLIFYYRFMTNALDMSKIHVNILDTDCYYFSVSGNPNEPNTQGFKHIIKDIDFYIHYYKLFLSDEDLLDKNTKISDQKKLLGCCVEKSYNSMICLGPKCYAGIDDKVRDVKLKELI